ncbi:DUF898 family protein [Sagittula sp. M10.9X]|uniref:DUF898 family protein n=1 Tax=Sagittula salina TaxID=2820268 RepID=A0A940MR33_9RHOB|nr:DUF898 family protein [Sagittula salina]
MASDEGGHRVWATRFAGRRWPLFKLVLGTGALTVLTLGIYRFWQKTRVRRWLWSAIRPGGYPLEYAGDPLEKLLGFLIAVVILAFYIGIVNLLLMFASFALFQGNYAAYALSLVGVFPIWFYARYRARRYILARTRWLGLRFGLEPGAWGFAIRALWHGFLALITAGLLWPRMTFKLEQYRTNRTFFGETRMHQDGRWTMLYGAMKWHFINLPIAFGGLICIGANEALALPILTLGAVLWLYAAVYYRVETRIRLTNHKRAGALRLRLTASPLRIFWILASGHTLALLVSALPTLILLGLFLELQSLETLVEMGLENTPPIFAGLNRTALIALSVMAYFSIFLVWTACTQAWVTLPLIRHYAQGLEVIGTEAMATFGQRPRDDHPEAEGFAEALDVGASL